METIKTVLVTTDFSETSQAAFGTARLIAERFGAKLIMLHVQELHLPPLVVEHIGGTGM